ncbi:protein transport protein S31 [Myotisia sp. PD_48]|nr:protein transport protein S31 [Myotisia sp. PD_48]
MVRLREIPRTATFAWSPGRASSFIATGTRAGAVDADFSNETFLELWDLDLDSDRIGAELQPAARVSTDSGFHDLAWAESDDSTRGIIGGALESGTLSLWDADKLLNGSSPEPVTKASIHSGAIKTLQFHPKHSNLLATGGSKGELFVTDLNNIDSPTRLGNVAARVDDIECLDWNKKVPHILVTGSSAGFVTVWDAKAGKESLTLNNLGRKAVSAVAWDPERSTKLVTSIPLESDPLILVWDLRNSNAPERILRGHESGVLSLSWCRQDPSLLLSSGKDNRTICWNPQSGEAYGEFPVVTNWTFQTRWNPNNPSFFATASFDGKISVQTIQNTHPETSQSTDNQPVNDEDFFAKAQTQPQASTFTLGKAPKWLERPVAASFGFGGKVVSVGLASSDGRSSVVRISKFDIDSNIGTATDSFETALNSGDLRGICESRVSGADQEEEKVDWKVMGTLISENPKQELIKYLGFSGDVDEAADSLSKLGLGSNEANGVNLAPPGGNGAKRHRRLVSIFDASADSDNFLSDLSPSKEAKTNNPFQLYSGTESEADRGITRALVLGQFEKALDICLQEDRMSDAFMVALCGGQKCIEKAQEAYLLKQSQGPNYTRLLAAVAEKNIWDVVHNVDLSNWKEAIAVICTFADATEFPDLCEALGDRLEEYATSEGNKESRKDASFCYMAGSKLEKVVSIWIEELKENENKKIEAAGDDTGFSIHVQVLQDFIEKVTVFRQVAKFQDSEQQKQSDWKLSLLYDKYIEYADIVATHGRLDVAEKYLRLLPASHPAGDVAKNRIRLATSKPAAKPAAAPRAQSTRLPPVAQHTPSPYQPQQTPMARGPTPLGNPYAPSGAVQPGPAYSAPHQMGYAPQGYQAPQQPSMPTQYSGLSGPGGVPPPPRASQSAAPTPAYTAPSNVPAWNDLPEGFARVPTPRRATPGITPVANSPFPNQPQAPQAGPPQPGPPPAGAPVQRTGMPVPPPPKGPYAPARVTSPPISGTPQGYAPERPPSTSNLYAPPTQQQVGQGMVPPPIPRGPSPYNAPPSNAPPTNRYAPNPASPPAGPPQQAPGPSPYAPQQFQHGAPRGPYAQHPGQPSHPPPPPHPMAPALQQQQQESRPGTAQSQRKASVPPKHPSGDRSHIPSHARPIFDILSGDMQRVKSRAPSSFKAQVNDTERRLNLLFDHLNNEDLLKPNTIDSMLELVQAIQARDYDTAQSIHLDILTNRTDECGNWMVGVKRLIGMSRATP